MAHITRHVLFLCCFVYLSAFQISHALEFSVAYVSNASRFLTDVGANYSMQTLGTASDFVLKTLNQIQPTDTKDVQRIGLTISDENIITTISGPGQAEIYIGAPYIQNYTGDVKIEFTGLLYHALTQVWQWNGNGQAPTGLTEGIADYVRLRAGFESSTWVKPGEGDRWDQGNDVTARFLEYCNNIILDGFVAELNKMMKDTYGDDFFYDLLGMNVDELWADYKVYHNMV